MNNSLKIALIIFIISSNLFFQSVEINGQLKVTNVATNNAANAVIVQNINGTFEKRDASTLGLSLIHI